MTAVQRRRWEGERGQGAWTYEPIQYERVVRAMKEYVGHDKLVRQEDFAARAECAGLDGRTLRQILSDADGVEFVLVREERGIYVAEFQEEAEGTTRLYFAQAKSMADRAARRQVFADDHLPRRQLLLGW